MQARSRTLAFALAVVVLVPGCGKQLQHTRTSPPTAPSPASSEPLVPAVELEPSLTNAPGAVRPTLYPVAIREGAIALAHFDRSRALVGVGTRVHVGTSAGLEGSPLELPEHADVHALTGDWNDRRLWLELRTEGVKRARSVAGASWPRVEWESETSEVPLRKPVFLRGAWMSLEQETGFLEARPRGLEGAALRAVIEKERERVASAKRRFVILGGDPNVTVPAIAKLHLIGHYEAHGDDLWAIAQSDKDYPKSSPPKLVRWTPASSRWTEVTLPFRRGSLPVPSSLITSNGPRIYVEATVPRAAGVDPPGAQWQMWICDGRHPGPETMTDRSRNVLAAFDGRLWSLLEPPDGHVLRIEENAGGGVYALVTRPFPIGGAAALFYKAPEAATWAPVELPRMRLVDLDPARRRTTLEQLVPEDVLVRNGAVWITASVPVVRSPTETSSPIARWVVLLRTTKPGSLIVLPAAP